jgi:hypothetical protein
MLRCVRAWLVFHFLAFAYELFLVRFGKSLSVFGFGGWMVCAVAGRAFFITMYPVWWVTYN